MAKCRSAGPSPKGSEGERAGEQARVRAAGGMVIRGRVYGVLAVSRALGHVDEKAVVTSSPFTSRTRVHAGDDFLVVASDGLWDVMDDQAVVDFVKEASKRYSAQELAEMLCERALDLRSRDNITIAVVLL